MPWAPLRAARSVSLACSTQALYVLREGLVDCRSASVELHSLRQAQAFAAWLARRSCGARRLVLRLHPPRPGAGQSPAEFRAAQALSWGPAWDALHGCSALQSLSWDALGPSSSGPAQQQQQEQQQHAFGEPGLLFDHLPLPLPSLCQLAICSAALVLPQSYSSLAALTELSLSGGLVAS